QAEGPVVGTRHMTDERVGGARVTPVQGWIGRRCQRQVQIWKQADDDESGRDGPMAYQSGGRRARSDHPPLSRKGRVTHSPRGSGLGPGPAPISLAGEG